MVRKKMIKLPKASILKNILCRCANLIRKVEMEDEGFPKDVPKGYFVVYVGKNRSRFIVPISLLSHAGFRLLLLAAEEEYGFHHGTGLTLPCDEVVFNSLTSVLFRSAGD